MKRKREIKIRLTEEEYLEIRARCDRARLAEWLRELALGQRKRRQTPTVDPALLRQISAIGNNLNQIARWCNQNGAADAVNVSAALVAINRELREIQLASQNQQ